MPRGSIHRPDPRAREAGHRRGRRHRAPRLACEFGEEIDLGVADPVMNPIDVRSGGSVLERDRHIGRDAVAAEQFAGVHAPSDAARADLAGAACACGLSLPFPTGHLRDLRRASCRRTAFQTHGIQGFRSEHRGSGAHQGVDFFQGSQREHAMVGQDEHAIAHAGGQRSWPSLTARPVSRSSSLSTS